MKPKPLSFQRAIVPTSLPGDGDTPVGHLRGKAGMAQGRTAGQGVGSLRPT